MKQYGNLDLRNMDCMELMREYPDKSMHLIIVDPPYYEVKGGFDFIWDSFESYLTDVEKWAIECKRLLADNGTLLWWGHAKKIAYTQIILDKLLCLENSAVWEKQECQTLRMDFKSARCFAPVTERLLVYSNDYEPSDWNKTGLERVMDEKIRPRHPFALYMAAEFKRAGVSNKEIAALFPSKTGNLTGCVSNWLKGFNTPTKEQYLKIRDHLNGEYLRKEYEDLRKEYEDLRKEYEDQRRFFRNDMKLTDVLKFSQEAHKTAQHDHPTQKAPTMTRALIRTCSKPGQSCLVPFLGSGTEAIEAYNHGLSVYGSELDPDYYAAMMERIDKETAQQELF